MILYFDIIQYIPIAFKSPNSKNIMDFTQLIPKNITKLGRYSVPQELFICTCIVLILFLILSIIITIFSIYRAFKGYSNTDYIADYEIKIEAEQTMKKIANE